MKPEKTKLENWICETEKIAVLTRPVLEDLQLSRLNSLLSSPAFRRGYYSNLPNRIESLSELSSLPFTTQEELSENSRRMAICSQADIKRIISDVTSGTTGPSKRVFYTETDIMHTIGFFAAGISEMCSNGDKVLIAMPQSGPSGLFELISAAVLRLGATPVACGVGKSFGEMADIMRSNRPDAFIGMPVPLFSLIRFMGSDFSVKRALISADSCPQSVETALVRALGTKLFPHYGSRETGLGGAVTCSAHSGMHIRENHIIAEIIAPDGFALPDGSQGELVITTIGLSAMPLIRYRTGDFCCIMPDACACGGVTKRLGAVFRDTNDEVSISSLDDALFSILQLVDYSIKKTDSGYEIFALHLGSENIAEEIRAAVLALYPNISFSVSSELCLPERKPLYLGKRHIIS